LEPIDWSFTFTSKDEKRCFMVARAAEWYVQKTRAMRVRNVGMWYKRGPKNYDEVLSTTSCGSAAATRFDPTRCVTTSFIRDRTSCSDDTKGLGQLEQWQRLNKITVKQQKKKWTS